MRRISLLVLGLFLASTAAAQTAWPFGGEQGFRKRDLYNLGPLGAKASDEVRGEPEPAGTGRRSVQMQPETGPDVGPERLRVEILYPGGPAATAGLQVGDVLIGIGGKKFTKGSFDPLAAAITKAMGNDKGGTVKLLVEREGKNQKIEVELPALGKAFAKPTSERGRALLLEGALELLASRQGEDGGYPTTLGGQTGNVTKVACAGLAWISGGSDLERGPYSDNVRRAWKYCVAHAGEKGMQPAGQANWNQENWGWVHAGIFLGELYQRSPDPDLLADLGKMVTGIQDNVEASGGYAHGPGGPNGLGYVELNIMSGLALSALGMCSKAGVELDDEKVAAIQGYIEASSSGGGVGYSTKDGQIGQGNIGRSAIAWLAYRNVGDGKAKFTKALGGYVKANVDRYLDGHASLMQHILFAGVAAQAHSGGVEKAYWATAGRDLVLALGPDGSFQPRPFHESLQMASNSDVTFGDTWTTACWAIVLGCKPDKKGERGLQAWMAK